MSQKTARAAGVGVAVLTVVLTGCAAGGENGTADGTVTLVTHDSFAVSEELLAAFEAETGLEVVQVAPGDGGALANQLVLTADSPLGDAVFGIDNAFASRVIDEGVIEDYVSPDLDPSAEQYLVGGLNPVDVGDVCLNIDTGWFAEQGIAEPVTFDDLLEPEYRDLTVVTNPATSSPGLAMLLATIGTYGDGWQEYWAQLNDNGLRVVDGWSDAYYVDFSAVEGGPRPIVLSYASSPAFTVTEDGSATTTAALLDTCFRQVEYAGVLSGAANPEGGQLLVDWLLSDAVQADIPESMYMYPANATVGIPAEWAQFAPLAPAPVDVTPEEIAENRDTWIEEWTQTVIG